MKKFRPNCKVCRRYDKCDYKDNPGIIEWCPDFNPKKEIK